MSCCELDLALLIPKKDSKDDIEAPRKVEPYFRYKSTEYRKTLRIKLPQWQPIKSRLKRFLNWITFVWCHSRARKCRKLTFVTIFSVLSILFLIMCVAIPLAFKYSKAFQRHIMFQPTTNTHKSYSAPIQFRKDYSMQTFIKPKNMLVVVESTFNASVGLWSLNSHINESNRGSWRKYVPDKQKVPYLLYFHDFSGDRRTYTKIYSVLLRHFHVIAFDYRGFGDSSPGALTETEMVSDSMELFKWLKRHTNSSIYVWGDRRGAALAALTVSHLQSEKIESDGIILENPSLSASEYLKRTWFIAKMVSYTLWYRQTIMQPLIESDLYYSIKDVILDIKCPIVFCVYDDYRNDFNIYVNEYSFDNVISQEHRRLKPNLGYYVSYNYDVSFFDDWIRSLMLNNRYNKN